MVDFYEIEGNTITPFTLDDKFIANYIDKAPFETTLGLITYLRTYSRAIDSLQRNEYWYETLRRVVEGCYNIQKTHCLQHNLAWKEEKAQRSAQRMYDHMFNFKVYPPGRALWMANTPHVTQHGSAALQNCAAVTTEDIDTRFAFPFAWAANGLMLGQGVSADMLGANKLTIKKPTLIPPKHASISLEEANYWLYERHYPLSDPTLEEKRKKKEEIQLEFSEVTTIPDSREGWVNSWYNLLNSYLKGGNSVAFDYSIIRPAGLPIKGFGGISSGPEPLQKCHRQMRDILNKHIGELISSEVIADLFNMLAACVVSGNVRRSAMLLLGNEQDEAFINLKNPDKNPDAYESYRWSSNNSISAKVNETDYSKFVDSIAINGEPGFIWLENARAYSRMCDEPDYKDRRILGMNPCHHRNSHLSTDYGPRTFGSLVGKKFKVINEDGEAVDSEVWSTGIKSLIGIRLSNDHIIKCTPDHIWKTLENEEGVEAKNLKGQHLKPYITTPNHDPEYLRYGFLQGDGCLHRLRDVTESDALYVNIGIDDGKIMKLFDIRISVEELNRTCFPIHGYNRKLKELGFSEENLPERGFPSTFDNWMTKDKLAFISGCYSANGCVLNSDITFRIQYKTTSVKMRDGLIRFLKGMGFSPYYTTNKEKVVKFDNGDYKCKESYDINLAKYNDIKHFSDSIGFYHDYKTEKLHDGLIKHVPKVMTIKTLPPEEVFDFTEPKTHWGVVEGYVSHNCVSGDTQVLTKYGNIAIATLEDEWIDIWNGYEWSYVQIKETGQDEPMFRVHLSNSAHLDCTDYHKWKIQLEDNIAEVETKDLKVDDRLPKYYYPRVNWLENKPEPVDRIKILKIERIANADKVYCFTEPKRHTGVFNGILTMQCGEIPLESTELCNLVTVVPSKHENYEEFQKSLKVAYMYAKSITLLHTESPDTNQVILKNRRIGISLSGIIDSFQKHGRRTVLEWCDKGYKYLKELDKQYSADWLCIPTSIKMTTVKPEGCCTASTLIGTDKGFFDIWELGEPEGEEWQNVGGNYSNSYGKSITKFYNNGIQDVYKLFTKNGIIERVTGEHKWKCYDSVDKKVYWVKTNDLIGHEQILSPIGYYNKTEESLLDITDEIRNSNNTYPERMNPKLAWLVGLMFSDNCINITGSRLVFNTEETNQFIFVKKIIKEIFNYDVVVDKKNNDRFIEIDDRSILRWLDLNKFNKTYFLSVPKKIRTASKESVDAFLKGFWKADDSSYPESAVICSGSYKFAHDIIILSRALGYAYKIDNTSFNGWGWETIDQWLIKPVKKDNTIETIDGNDYFLEKIVSIVKEPNKEKTYDIEVDETHEYVANGLVSHNTVSLLANVSPGIHYPHDEYYIRRIRIAKNSNLCKILDDANYHYEVERDNYVYEFPIHSDNFERAKNDVSIWEQVKNAADMQRVWADNSVSVTVSFKSSEKKEIVKVLEAYETELKGISFIPIDDAKYDLMPYESISKEKYEEISKNLKPIDYKTINLYQAPEGERFCTSDSCALPKRKTEREVEERFCDSDGCEFPRATKKEKTETSGYISLN